MERIGDPPVWTYVPDEERLYQGTGGDGVPLRPAMWELMKGSPQALQDHWEAVKQAFASGQVDGHRNGHAAGYADAANRSAQRHALGLQVNGGARGLAAGGQEGVGSSRERPRNLRGSAKVAWRPTSC